MKRLFALLSIFCLFGLTGYAQSVKELQRQQQQIQSQIQETNKLLQQTKKNETATVNKLNLITKNISDRKRLINTISREINAIDNDMKRLTNQRNALQVELEGYKADYAELVRRTHYADIQSSPLLFLLSSSDFQQLIRRIRYMREFTAYRKRQVEKIRATQDEIDIQNALLQDNRDQKKTALTTQQREKETLSRDERKQQKMLTELKKKKNDLAAQLKKQQKKANELNKKIDEAIRKQTQTTSTLTPEQKLIAGGFEKNKGKLPWPIEKGFISGRFGTYQHPVYEHVTVNNKGLYMQTTAGAYARAVYEGEVSSCMKLGNTYAVIVQHGNYRTVYSNLKSLSVKQGDHLTAKQKIGVIYSDAEDDNKTELYFQIYQDRTLLDPSLWLAQ